MRVRKMNNVINVMLQVAAECEGRFGCKNCLYFNDDNRECFFHNPPEDWKIAHATEKWRIMGLMNHWGKYGHDKGGTDS